MNVRSVFGSRAIARGIVLSALSVSALFAQTTVTLPDENETTVLTASVSDQAKVTVPAGVSFDVVDIASSTAADSASVTAENIVLASETNQLKVSLQANAAAFTPPVALASTWSASDVTWNASTGAAWAGASGQLSESAYTEVATCDTDVATCSTTGLVFTLGANTAVKRSGNHTLTITWKFESI